MLTPQDVTNKEFDKAVFGGYDISAVDGFLEQLSQDYATLYRENAILKNKIKVLVDKVEEYRSTEDAMRMALVTAKKTAKELTEAAETEKGHILAEAEEAAEARRQALREELAGEEEALLAAKRRTAAYLQKLRGAMDEYTESLARIYDFSEPEPEPVPEPEPEPAPEPVPESAPAPAPEPPAEDAEVAAVAELIQRNFSANTPPAEDKVVPFPENGSSKLPHIDYTDLKFGDRYNPKGK